MHCTINYLHCPPLCWVVYKARLWNSSSQQQTKEHAGTNLDWACLMLTTNPWIRRRAGTDRWGRCRWRWSWSRGTVHRLRSGRHQDGGRNPPCTPHSWTPGCSPHSSGTLLQDTADFMWITDIFLICVKKIKSACNKSFHTNSSIFSCQQ